VAGRRPKHVDERFAAAVAAVLVEQALDRPGDLRVRLRLRDGAWVDERPDRRCRRVLGSDVQKEERLEQIGLLRF
jgi:hypothetical protein